VTQDLVVVDDQHQRPLGRRVISRRPSGPSHTVARGSHVAQLTTVEYRVPLLFLQNPERALSRTMIAQALWDDHRDRQSKVIDVHIGRLRRKLDPGGRSPAIRTIRHQGYELRVSAG